MINTQGYQKDSLPAWLLNDDHPCKDYPTDIFFADVVLDDEPSPEELALIKQVAKSVCDGCPYKEPCEEHAIMNDELGLWGGRVFGYE